MPRSIWLYKRGRAEIHRLRGHPISPCGCSAALFAARPLLPVLAQMKKVTVARTFLPERDLLVEQRHVCVVGVEGGSYWERVKHSDLGSRDKTHIHSSWGPPSPHRALPEGPSPTRLTMPHLRLGSRHYSPSSHPNLSLSPSTTHLLGF